MVRRAYGFTPTPLELVESQLESSAGCVILIVIKPTILS